MSVNSDDDELGDADDDGGDSPHLVVRLMALWNLRYAQSYLIVPKTPVTKDRNLAEYKIFAKQL